MRNMWLIPFVAAVAIAATGCEQTPVAAAEEEALSTMAGQEGNISMMGGAAGILRLSEALELTEAQVSEIKEVLAGVRGQNAPIREQLKASGDLTRRPGQGGELSAGAQQMRENTQAAVLQIQEILTPEQRALAKQLTDERRAQARERRNDGEPRVGRSSRGDRGGMLLRLADELELTDDQVARIETIRLEVREKNQPLLEQLRESGERPFGRSAGESNPLVKELRANSEAAAEAVRSVLTEQQQAKLNELRQARIPGKERRPGRNWVGG